MVYPEKKSENRAIFFQEKNANVDGALKTFFSLSDNVPFSLSSCKAADKLYMITHAYF